MKDYFKRMYKESKENFFNELKTNLKNSKKEFIITANPETFMYGEKDEEINKMLLDKNVTVVPDGIGIVKAASFIGTKAKQRIPGVDIAEKLLEYAAVGNLYDDRFQISVDFCGDLRYGGKTGGKKPECDWRNLLR